MVQCKEHCHIRGVAAMDVYALKVVPADWDLEMPLPFTQEEYNQYHDQIVPDMRILIYKASPVDAIVSEGAVTGVFINVGDWPATTQHQLNRPDMQTAYLLPVRVIY